MTPAIKKSSVKPLNPNDRFEAWWKDDQKTYQPLQTHKRLAKFGWDACVRTLGLSKR